MMSPTPDLDEEAFEALEPELERTNPHEVVVFQNGRLLAVGKTYKEVLGRAHELVDRGELFLARVGPYDPDVLCLY